MPKITISELPEGSTVEGSWEDGNYVVSITKEEEPPPVQQFGATLVDRTDYVLTIALTAPGPVQMIVVQSSPPYAWRGEPTTVNPGQLDVSITHYTDFVKFMYDGQSIDVPTAEDAANYKPSNGGPTPEPPTDDVISRMGFGVNVERGRPWVNFGLGEPGNAENFVNYFTSLGATHTRLFYPWRPGGGWWDGEFRPMLDTPVGERPTKDQIDRLMKCAYELTKRGFIVHYDCCDVMSPDRDCGEFGHLVEPHLRTTVELVRDYGMDPNYFIIGAINEHEASDNPTWNPIRMQQLDLLDSLLPEYTLATGGANWKDSAFFLQDDYQVWGKRPVLHDYHNYHASWWDFEGLGRALREKHARLGTQGTFGELGPGSGDQGQQFQLWVETMEASYPHLLTERVTIWAVTDGSWSMNRGWSDFRFWDGSQGWDPKVEQTFKKYAEQAKPSAAR